MDWQLQYERAEMIRQFQRDLLVGMSHQLRSPAARQDTILTLLREAWYESEPERQSSLEQMQVTVREWHQRWQDFEDLITYPMPIDPIHCQPMPLGSLWQPLDPLLLPLARDRGIPLVWSAPPERLSTRISGDPHACLEIGLGLTCWSLEHLIHGRIDVTVKVDPIQVVWGIQGSRLPLEVSSRFWQVPQRLVQVMGGTLRTETTADRLEITWTPLPWDTLESNSLGAMP